MWHTLNVKTTKKKKIECQFLNLIEALLHLQQALVTFFIVWKG